MPWITGFGASQPYSRREFQETLWERFRGLSGIFRDFFREVPAVLGVWPKKVLVSQERVSGFPEKGADLRGSPGTSGEVRGTSGNFRGTSGLLLSSTVRELPGKSSKNFRGSSGNFRGSSGTSQKLGEPDSLPATRQICLQQVSPSSKPTPEFAQPGLSEDFSSASTRRICPMKTPRKNHETKAQTFFPNRWGPRKSHEKVTGKNVTSNEKSSESE